MRLSFHLAPGLLSLAAVLAAASPAAADDAAAAEALFNRGLAEMQGGRYDTGCKAIAESQRLDPRPGTLFTLATCEMEWGHVASASTHFGDYLTLYGKMTPEQQARQKERPQVAAKAREDLAPQLPELTLSLPPGAPAGTVVKRDGVIVAEAALGIGLPVDPGDYLLSTEAPGGAVWEQRVAIGKGEKKQVELGLKASAPGGAPPTTGGSGAQRKAAYAVGGLGLAGLAVGGVMGGLTLGKKSTLSQHCGKAVGSADPTACDPIGIDASRSAQALGLGSTIGFVVGLAGLGTGVVLLLTEPKRPADLKAGAGRRWISAGVLSAGPAGTTVGARGAW